MISVSKNVITKLFKDTTLIENRDLAYEVYLVNDLYMGTIYCFNDYSK
jgi:hypothetical protein